MKTRTLIPILVAAVTALSACDETPTEPRADEAQSFLLSGSTAGHAVAADEAAVPHDALRVLSRNVFLGADLEPVVGAAATGDPGTIAVAVAQAWAQIEANDFPSRARVIAREISASEADVVGLQEVALFRTQFPGDGPASAATEVAYDYLEILLSELEAMGSSYSVAASGSSIQVELPAADPTSPTGVMDVQYTDRDVVLVREGVEVVGSESDVYAVALPVPGPLGISLPRSYNRVDLVHRGQPYHFVNTHLETDEASIQVQTAQADELVSMLSTVNVPTIVVGDLNGRPTSQGDGTLVYALMEAAGFVDAWAVAGNPSDPTGYTCCFDKNLNVDPADRLYERIDYVFARGASERPMDFWDSFTVGAGGRYGVVAGNRRPADHAGVLAAVMLADAPVAE